MNEKNPCENCVLLQKKEAEAAHLEKELDALLRFMDLLLSGMDEWARQNGLLFDMEDKLEDGDNQFFVLLESVRAMGEDASLNRFVSLLESFNRSNKF